MDKLAQAFLQQVQNLQNTLSQLLEKQPKPESKESPHSFEVTTDLSGLESLGKDVKNLPEQLAVEQCFRRLNPYFEAGLLLKINKHNGSPQLAFRHGQMHPLLPEDLRLAWPVPEFPFAEIKILKADSLKREFEKLGFVDPQFEDVLAFRVLPDWMILLVSKLPDVFLKHHAGKIHGELIKIFSDMDRL